MSEETTKKTPAKKEQQKSESKPICGIVMPISPMDELHTPTHWGKVQRILKEAINEAEFEAKPVWESEGVNIIHKNIVQNLYDNDIIICDVSCNNPNVMFELGLRLAFDKPTIVVAEKGAKLTFDTAMIEHVMYPQNLDYYDINAFKSELVKKLRETYEKSKNDENYSVFLKHFREIKPTKIPTIEGSLNDIVLDRLSELSDRIDNVGQIAARNSRVYNRHQIDIDQLRYVIKETIDNYCINKGIDRESANSKNVNFEEIINDVARHSISRAMPISMDILHREISRQLPPF